MSIASRPTLTGSLKDVMDALTEVEAAVHDDLRVYRWRPRVPDLPCLWNWIPDAPLQQLDTGAFRDNVTVNVTVGIRHSDLDEEMARLEEYADAFRFVIDPALHTHNPLGAKKAIRQNMRTIGHEFASGELPVLAIEFPLLIQLDRLISPN